jgi:hypothetical protein
MAMAEPSILTHIAELSLTDALELRQAIDQRIAVLALKSLSTEALDRIDDQEGLSDAVSLVQKSQML